MNEALWCRYHNKGNPPGDDRITAEILRCLICDKSYDKGNSGNGGGNEDLTSDYADLMRSSMEDGGINSYAETVLPLIANQRNDSDNWSSELNFSSFVSELVSQSPAANTEAQDNAGPIIIPLFSKTNLEKPTQSDFNQMEAAARPAAAPRVLPIVQATNPAGTTYPPREPTEPLPVSSSDASAHDSFRTAKEQLIFNQANSNKSYTSTNVGGQAKKSLGLRRIAAKVVSPLPQDNSNGGQSNVTNCISKAKAQPSVYDEELELPEQLSHLDPNIVKLIMSEIMDTSAEVSWSDIAGLQFAKKTLKEIIILPMLRPDIFSGLRGPPKGLLLFGPPGTGKTLIGKCVASQSRCTFFSISASSLTSKWVGEGEKMVRALFAVARYKQPAVVFIDEIDSLLTQRSESEHESSRRIKTEFLVQMDGVGCDGDDRILVIGATNRPQELDEAARRRFVKRLYIPLPESAARQAIVRHHMQRQHVQMSDSDLESIVTMTAGYSGADMTNLCKEAALGPVRDIHFDEIETIQLDQVRPINSTDFIEALKQVRASVDPSDLDSYLAWNSKFGSWAIKDAHT